MKKHHDPSAAEMELYAYDILDTDEEQEYNDLVELASFICDCPISMITFVDGNRQWFKARKKIPHKETPIEDFSFCAHTAARDQLLVVEDALQDDDFKNFKNVTGDIKIRFYAGSPIRSANGNNIGAICVIDTQPKKLSDRQLGALEKLSRQVSKLLELRSLNKGLSLRSDDLLQSAESYREYFNYSPMPLWVYDYLSDKFLVTNIAAQKLYGYTAEEFTHLSLYDIITQDEQEAIDLMKRSQKEGKVNLIKSHRKKNGKIITVDVTLTNIHYNGHPMIMATMIDLSEKLNLQQQLVEEKIYTKKKIEKATLFAQKQEREHLGRELHDNINQMLASIKLYLELAYSNDDMRLKLIDQSKNYVENTINEVRKLSHHLVDSNTKGLNLIESIEELLEPYVIGNSFEIDMEVNCDLMVLTADMKIGILRILQEAVQNVEKYAKATQVSITISCHNKNLTLTFTDNGKGFEHHKIKPGIGLKNISERAMKLRGKSEVKSQLGKGTIINVTIPLEDTII